MPDSGDTRRIFTVPPGADFLDALAHWLTQEAGAGASSSPFALSDALILLPTRRAARALGERLAARHGGPVLLPRIRALGDVDLAEIALDADETPDYPDPLHAPEPLRPAIAETERVMVLARLIEAWGARSAADLLSLEAEEAPLIPGSPAMAARLAGELARLIDSIETEGVDIAALKDIVPDGFARYWQIALDFLGIVSDAWPAFLGERGLMTPAERRNALIAQEADRLARLAPQTPVIAAGSTGSIPATARLLGTIAALPAGAVVLPGLDRDAPDAEWLHILASPSHPQHGMARLLDALSAGRATVADLPGAPAPPVAASRTHLARTLMQPAESTDGWAALADPPDKALDGLTYVAARTVEEEALAIALILRDCAEDPDCTAALVTPDRTLARRVAAEMMRWGIALDDSAGMPLASTPPGTFARQAARLLATGAEPVPLLALMKHPLTRLGMEPGEMRRAARTLEIAVLRGPRPDCSVDGLRNALAAARARIAADEERDAARKRLRDSDFDLAGRALDALAAALAALPAGDGSAGGSFARHAAFCAALATGPDGDAAPLYAGPAGKALQDLFAALPAGDAGVWAVADNDYPALFDALLTGRPVRPDRPGHPRLAILGLLEARLLHADLVVLGGLNEGVWPAQTRTDPWLSRPMRAALGLPAAERRIGLAAHDFAQAFAAPRVVLTRAERVDGDPSVESRWLKRLDAVLSGSGGLKDLRKTGAHWLAMARDLDASQDWRPAPPPAPRPPLHLRPRRLSVTEIETWNRDPYAIYARRILRLEPLDGLDEAPDAAARGTLIHDALSALFEEGGAGGSVQEMTDRLIAIGDAMFARLPDAPEIKAFWRRRFARAAAWFAARHAATRGTIAKSATELSGSIEIDAPGGLFTLRARADRIDVRDDGTLAIIDYKTGALPGRKEVSTGLAPQLPLEAAMARAGGFAPHLAPAPVTRLSFIQLSGGTPPGEVRALDDTPPEQLALEALEGLQRKVAAFDSEETPYLSRPRVKFASRFAPYDHLARVGEWARLADAGKGGAGNGGGQ